VYLAMIVMGFPGEFPIFRNPVFGSQSSFKRKGPTGPESREALVGLGRCL